MAEVTKAHKVAAWLIIGVSVYAMLHSCGVVGRKRTEAEIQQAQKEDRKRDLIAAGMVDIKRRLRDPSSAEFGTVIVSEKNGEAVCGTVNAKNGFGGYTGMQPFVITLSDAKRQGQTWIGDMAAWNKHCAGAQ